ncbi:MAG: hypothetical protein GKR91_20540 [Pseudomonadales bacterium]|nr:hypothetical protein [Pseudomonadales bacterium]
MITVPNFQILALNNSQTSENRIHSDDIAAKYGFEGALVSGANVFGYLSQPLVRKYKDAWLSEGIMDVVFLKPAYQDNLLTIKTENIGSESSQRNHHTYAYNENDVLIAKLESWLPDQLPEINALARHRRIPEEIERREISWDLVTVGESWPSYRWCPTLEDNSQRVALQRDQAEVYAGDPAFIHPFYLLEACNKALMRQFILPAWIHTGSKLTLRKPLRAGQEIEVRAVPMEKWERKGHEFIKLYVAMLIGDEVALEVEHTAIFKIAS